MNITTNRIEEVKHIKKNTQNALKGKEYKDITPEEKELLIKTMAKILGLI